MLVKMLAIACGPEWAAAPGEAVDRPEAEARQLVDGGFAVALEPFPEADDEGDDDEGEAETAEEGDTDGETAEADPTVKPKRRRGRRGR